MAKMRAVQVSRAGGPLELVERRVPDPGPTALTRLAMDWPDFWVPLLAAGAAVVAAAAQNRRMGRRVSTMSP